MNSRLRGSTGQALTEFALVLPIFAILLFGIIDFGRLVYTANAMSNGAREGARAGSVGSRPSPTCDGLSRSACVIEIAGNNSWGVAKSSITTTVTCERIAVGDSTPNALADPNSCQTDDLIRVRNETSFGLVTPLIAQFIGSFTLSGEALVTVNN